jgi:hypothetical protein
MNDVFRSITLFGATGAFGAACFAVPHAASAAFLYWAAPQLHTTSKQTCFQWAGDTMRYLGFHNVRSTGVEVTGSRGSSYAAVTCLQTTPRTTAMVMVVGEDASETANLRDDLRDKIAGTEGL